jgi:3-deoxy-D-manno-octulosonate 8-phosphate phosphatase KdsC-like HAD superfamily phosphatase
VAREDVLAIGDNHIDLEMLTFAGIPVVMGNGVQEGRRKTYLTLTGLLMEGFGLDWLREGRQ